MAEQSIGMTTGSGDGVAGGYPASRMLTMETGMGGTGVLLYGGLLAVTGTGTANLAIADGAALVSGYYYENTSSATINVSTLNGVYNLCVLVNNSASTLAVARSATGTSTPAYSVRVALYSGTPAVPYLLLGTVTVAAAVVSAITPTYAMYADTRQLPYQPAIELVGGTATLTTANTQYDITGYSTSTTTTDAIISGVTSTGIVTVRRAGWYRIDAYATYTNGTTGNRNLVINAAGAVAARAPFTAITATTYAALSTTKKLASGDTINISGSATIATQSVTTATLTVTWA
jgi:hypothetical protein